LIRHVDVALQQDWHMLIRRDSAERRQEMAQAASGGDREHRIREIAYFIWIEEGCPNGRDQDHWERACERLALLEAAPDLTAKEPAKPAKAKPAPATRKPAGKR
jgi:hypothetical protein